MSWSKNTEIGPDFRYISTTRGAMAKRMAALDSAHQTGLFTFFGNVLTVVWGLPLVESRNSEIGHDFHDISTKRGAVAKRMTPFDSAHRIALSTLSEGVLTVDEGVCRWGFKICGIWDVFNYFGRTRRDTAKRR